MSKAIVRITEEQYTITISTGSTEPGLGKMAAMSDPKALRSFDVCFHYSPLPGADKWEIAVQGLLEVEQGEWVLDREENGHKTVYLSKPGGGRLLLLRPYAGAGVFGESWQGWPDIPFRKGLYGNGSRIDPSTAGTLNPTFSWTCTSVS